MSIERPRDFDVKEVVKIDSKTQIEKLDYEKVRTRKEEIERAINIMSPATERIKLFTQYDVRVFKSYAQSLNKIPFVQKGYGFWYGYIMKDKKN